MLGKDPFWFGLITKYAAIFGTLFNEISIQRFTPEGAVKEQIRVPISNAHRDKMLARLTAEPNIDEQDAVTLPRLSFQMGDPVYDPSRTMNQIGQSVTIVDQEDYKRQYNPVAYNFPFKLWVYSKNMVDGNKIIEQILPAFRPDFTVEADLIPEMDETRDVVIQLESVSLQDNHSDDYKIRRAVVWELSFTLKGWLYGPVHRHPVIKFIDVKFYDATRHDNISDAVGNTAAIDRVTVQPGLLANGSPTSNIDLTIPYAEIDEDDDWAYIVKVYGTLIPSDGSGGADEPVEEH